MKNSSRLRERLSIRIAKTPARMILLAIVLFNVFFIVFSAAVISALAPATLKSRGLMPSIFYTISMIMDAGCIQYVVEDVGTTGVAVIIFCLAVVLIGMITFTGGVIGYVTNFISDFISNSNAGSRRLIISGHTVILNWNSRASEIVNDLLYTGRREKIVVLVSEERARVEDEINNRLADTLMREKQELDLAVQKLPLFEAIAYRRKHAVRNLLTIIVREGDTYSSKQLTDICLEHAKTVIILNNSIHNGVCAYATEERVQAPGKRKCKHRENASASGRYHCCRKI